MDRTGSRHLNKTSLFPVHMTKNKKPKKLMTLTPANNQDVIRFTDARTKKISLFKRKDFETESVHTF
jgi:hypothetical protein